MSESKNYNGSCFCGDVKFSLSNKPEVMAYCHCNSCRKWSAGSVSSFTLWKPENLHITQGADNIAEFNKNPETNNKEIVSQRKWCKSCGGHLFTEQEIFRGETGGRCPSQSKGSRDPGRGSRKSP